MWVKIGDCKNLVVNTSVSYMGVTKCTASKHSYSKTARNPTRKPKNSNWVSFLLNLKYKKRLWDWCVVLIEDHPVESLNILPVPCVYIMETVCYIKLSNKGLKQNSAIHDHKTCHRSDFQTQFCRTNMLKKSVSNLGTKLYNRLPNHFKNLEDFKPFKKQVKPLLLQQSFYSIEEYLFYV
jgi:hypothetical protein